MKNKTTQEPVNPFKSQFTSNESREAFNEILSYAIDRLKDLGTGAHADDLHNEIFNTDYFIIGYYQAEQFLKKVGIFKAIEVVKEYEENNFGEVNTDFSSSEKVCNMYVYIIGEEILNSSRTLKTLRNENGGRLNEEEVNKIVRELSYISL